jgi:hypothetical protein
VRSPVFETAGGGEWFVVRRRDQLLACCDCGLAHSVDFRVRRGGKLEMRAWRLNLVTATQRRRRARAVKATKEAE